ncbi:hypothetical protein GIB67_035724 [Kingdonia uniflora]|uniref:Uncharacterized protein n=1 Tax=Kingdonia uniflora TaxID=39325 RepID=A0A7J7M5R4_9MAGN|nr:hypothetical protein GIB67_035724 [Kingdonia uniflora]
MVDEVDLVRHLSPVIGVGDEEDTVTKLVEWPRLKGSRVEYPTGSSRFRDSGRPKVVYMGSGGTPSDIGVISLGLAVSVKEGITSICCLIWLKKRSTAQFNYRLTLPLSNLAKSVMNMIGAFPAQLNCNFWEVILVCETLNERWAVSGSERRITFKDFLEYYAMKYVTTTDGAYHSSSSSRPCFFDLSSAGRVWNDNLLWVSGINRKVSWKESFIDVIARKDTELEAVLKELEISRFKRVANKDDKVRRSQAKRRMVEKTPDTMEVKLLTLELNTPLKLAWLNKMPDGPVDMATVFSTVMVFEETDKIAEEADLRPHFEVEASLLEEQCRAKAREKMVVIVDDDFKKNNLAGKLYQLRYTKAKILAFSEGNYEEKEIMDEEEVEEMEDGLNVDEKTAADNLETIDQKELDAARERKEQILLYNAEYAEEYEALISQYEDRLDNNVKLSLKLEEAKSQVKDRTATILSRDLALNQLTSELAELKEKAASGSRHEAELAEYCIRALNDEIYDMKCNIHALNEQLLKKEIDLETTRTNSAVSEADFEKLNNSIAGKDLELHNSAKICDSLIARLDRLKADLLRLKGREAQSRADFVEVLPRRVVQRDKEMHKIINQLCARISELERELRVRELKNEKDLKFELDKRDGEIASGERSREMKEFLRRKEELVENMPIDLTISWQKSIDLTRQMSECIDQLTAELA